MKIGVIVASRKEREAFFEVFGKPTLPFLGMNNFEVSMWKLDANRSIYLILGGVGEIASASSTQYLIDHYEVDRIINYGVVGGLSEEFSEKQVGIVSKIVHYDFDMSCSSNYKVGEYPHSGIFHTPKGQALLIPEGENIDRFICASADKVVGAGQPKRELRQKFGADICEMEAAGIVMTCNRNGIPCTFVKAISDGVDGDLEAFEKNVHEASRNCVELIAKFI